MSQRVTLELPDELLVRAERLAVLTRRDVTDVLVDAVSAALPSLEDPVNATIELAKLSDEEVLRLADPRLPRAQERRLTGLLDRQQSGLITGPERNELLALMQVYETGWLRQAEALAEAVRRGLRAPLSP